MIARVEIHPGRYHDSVRLMQASRALLDVPGVHDALVAIRHRTTLDGSHDVRRPNSEFYLRPPGVTVDLLAFGLPCCQDHFVGIDEDALHLYLTVCRRVTA